MVECGLENLATAERREANTMTKNNKQLADREALERLLDIYGADRTRWPARERLRFASVLSEDNAASRMLSEAKALDALLDRASRPSETSVEALKERIMAAALREHPAQVSVPMRPAASVTSIWSPRRVLPAIAPRFAEWPAAAVLAASLVLGVMLGSAGTFDATMNRMAQAAGLQSAAPDNSTVDSAQLALGDEIDSQYQYEDLL